MSKRGQKEAVIMEVKSILPNFIPFQNKAILMLSNPQLEVIKTRIAGGIAAGTIEYSKDPSHHAEVVSYARSMVMNHLKKAKELNGGLSYTPNSVSSGSATPSVSRSKEKSAPKGVDLDLVPEELKDFVKSLK